MSYFAGLFDAEGHVSLMRTGHFLIAIEITNQRATQLLQETFKGKVYERERGKRKKSYTWTIATNRESALNFIESIYPFCVIKQSQLDILRNYLNQTRLKRRETRIEFISSISSLKKPEIVTPEYFLSSNKILTDEPFFKWLAGFLDGDGTFSLYEYQNLNNRSFDSYISIFNSFPEPIKYVQDRIEGSIIKNKGTNFPIWKWVCNQKNSEFVCKRIEPYLLIKKEQCKLVIDFLKIKETKTRLTEYSSDTVEYIRNLIKQIKFHNSL